MLCLIITFSLLSVISVDGIEPETGLPSTRAVSTQSYHRGDVPLSYTVTSYHDYTTIRPDIRTPIYAVNNHVPQYSPPKHQLNQPQFESSFKEQLKSSLLNQFQKNIPQTTDININRNILEPRLVAKHERFQNVIYNSFVPGHNVAIAPRFRHKSPVWNDLYTNYQEPVQPQKINIVPKHVINEIQKQPKLVQKQVILTDPESPHFQNTGFPAVPIENISANNYDVSNKVHEHKEVLFPQLPVPRAPRLHLNIARVYGIAHISHQAPEPTGHEMSRKKPPSYTQAIIAPKPFTHEKTLLYPVQNYNYPV